MTSDLLTPIPRNRPVGRYAPSPTGDLHLGNLRTALLAWRQIRELGGSFILRIEDVDAPRTVPGCEARMIEDLRWLGLDWDEGPDVGGPAGPYRQSERSPIYEAALERLAAAGRTYPCTCSRKDLREASAPHGPEGPVYPGTCRDADPAAQRAHPLGAATRLRVDREPIVGFTDAIAGPQRFDLRALCGDFIVRRRDGLWAYQLACAVDDALMGVTRVLRGDDLLTSTPRQIAVMRALGLPEPVYAHAPLVVDECGERMCKRDGSQSLRSLREAGLTPEKAREAILNAPLAAGGIHSGRKNSDRQ
jgi:glutamyl-tRNA synthetase